MGEKMKKQGPFLQPLAVGSVCLIFVLLLLTMGIMDYRTLEKTLSDYMEKKARAFISIFQGAVTDNLKWMDYSFQGQVLGILREEGEPVLPQETFVMSLMALAQRIDHDNQKEPLKKSELSDLVQKEGLWLVAFLIMMGGKSLKTDRSRKAFKRPFFPWQNKGFLWK